MRLMPKKRGIPPGRAVLASPPTSPPRSFMNLLALALVLLLLLPVVPAQAACPSDFSGTAVHGIDVCAGKGIAGRDLAHAASAMAGILDFDGDGAPDNPEVAAWLGAH